MSRYDDGGLALVRQHVWNGWAIWHRCLFVAFLECVYLVSCLRHVLSMLQRKGGEIFLRMIYHHWGLIMVSGMTRFRTGFVGGIDGVSWIINRQLNKCCAGFAEDLLEESVIRLVTSASQKDIYLCRIKLVLYSAPPVNSGLKVKEDLLSTSALLSMRRNQ